ncbi:lysophospholipase D GDPD1-like isoform X1 [Lineus longissimus]|uniref:lysophospholipase D GDPD1-like isoform X1 n=1 Tax=Lineus longissimus TaxID=88925 RepID=UPI002B4F2D9D
MAELLTILLPIMIVAAVVGGYVFASLLLLKFPTLLHKKKDIKFKCRHISHRGGAGENLENTMTAFRHAHALGTEMLEIDLQLTRDGEVVVSHDNTLERTAGQDILISETDYKDLPLLRHALKLDFDQRCTCEGKEDRKIPLLRELFEAFPDLPINIDIKFESMDLIERVNDLIQEFNREHITVWGNRSTNITNKCYKMNPDIHVFVPLKKVVGLVIAFYFGLLPFIPLKEGFYEIPMLSMFKRREKFPNWQMSRTFRILLTVATNMIQSKAMLKHLRERGIQVYLWVLNDEEEYEQAFKLGATGVMTDFPTKLRDFLDNHPEYIKE